MHLSQAGTCSTQEQQKHMQQQQHAGPAASAAAHQHVGRQVRLLDALQQRRHLRSPQPGSWHPHRPAARPSRGKALEAGLQPAPLAGRPSAAGPRRHQCCAAQWPRSSRPPARAWSPSPLRAAAGSAARRGLSTRARQGGAHTLHEVCTQIHACVRHQVHSSSSNGSSSHVVHACNEKACVRVAPATAAACCQ